MVPANPSNFNVDNVRIVKILGSALPESAVVRGMLLKRDAEGSIKAASDAKVVVFAQGVDTAGPETKGTVLLKSADELESYSRCAGGAVLLAWAVSGVCAPLAARDS